MTTNTRGVCEILLYSVSAQTSFPSVHPSSYTKLLQGDPLRIDIVPSSYSYEVKPEMVRGSKMYRCMVGGHIAGDTHALEMKLRAMHADRYMVVVIDETGASRIIGGPEHPVRKSDVLTQLVAKNGRDIMLTTLTPTSPTFYSLSPIVFQTQVRIFGPAPYSPGITISATHPDGPVIYSAYGLPDGLVINAETGVISGQSYEVGTHIVTIIGTVGQAITGSIQFTMGVTGAITFLPIADIFAPAGDPISIQPDATYLSETVTFSAVGLPNGVSISPSTGLISGQVSTSGTYEITVTATVEVYMTASQTFTIGVA